jgi:hypothetical protein
VGFQGWSALNRLRKGASAVLAIIVPIFLWTPISWAAECLHLGLTIGFGAGQLGAPPPVGAQFAVHDWSVGLADGPNTFLIYDVTDRIALPLEEWREQAALKDWVGKECAGRVRRLLSHYYVCVVG